MMGTEKTIRTFIVDDEQPSRNELRYLLGKFEDVRVVGEAASYNEAIRFISTQQPHVVFLDIQLTGITGIQMAKELMQLPLSPFVVFATAHNEYAIEAFDVNAIDYLLKPFSEAKLERCIKKIKSFFIDRSAMPITKTNKQLNNAAVCMENQKLAIETNGKAYIINTNDIVYACCNDGQVIVHTTDKVYQTHLTLQDLQMRINRKAFFRCHRSYLVNLEKIREIIPWFNGTYNLVLDGVQNKEIPVSRQQAPIIKTIFNL